MRWSFGDRGLDGHVEVIWSEFGGVRFWNDELARRLSAVVVLEFGLAAYGEWLPWRQEVA